MSKFLHDIDDEDDVRAMTKHLDVFFKTTEIKK